MAQQPIFGNTEDEYELQKLQRRRALADLMAASARQPLGPTEFAGRQAVRKSPLEGLAKLAMAYQANQEGRSLDNEEKALRKSRYEGIAKAMSDFNTQTAPRNVQTPNYTGMTGSLDEQDIPTSSEIVTPSAEDKRAAALQLYAKVGDPRQAASFVAQDALKAPTYSYRDVGGSIGVFDDRGNMVRTIGKTVSPDARLRNETQITTHNTPSGSALLTNDAGAWGDPYSLNGQTVQRNSRTGQIRQAVSQPAQTSNTVINAGPKAFETELGKLDAEQLGKYRTSAEAGFNTLNTVANLKSAIQKGVYSGGGAGLKADAASLINGLTGATPKKLPGTEVFNSEASNLVLDRIKALGANPSDADRKFLLQTIPNISTSPQARDALINFMEQKANQSIDLYKRADSHARSNRGLGGFDPFAGRNQIRVVDW